MDDHGFLGILDPVDAELDELEMFWWLADQVEEYTAGEGFPAQLGRYVCRYSWVELELV